MTYQGDFVEHGCELHSVYLMNCNTFTPFKMNTEQICCLHLVRGKHN